MLIRKPILERIKAGDVSLAFRRWQRPAVNQGSTFKTTVGVLSVQRVEKIPLKSISESDARNAGYPNLNSLLTDLNRFEGPSIESNSRTSVTTRAWLCDRMTI